MKRQPQTPKENKFIQEYLVTGNATEAAMRSYDCVDRDSARSLGAQNLAKLSIPEIMEANGLTLDFLTKKLIEGLNATKFNSDSNIPDHLNRSRYLQIAFKLYYSSQPLPAKNPDITLNQVLSFIDKTGII